MQDSTESKNENDIKDITLKPGIYDLTVPIRNYLENDVPIPDEELNVLKTFDREYSFEEDVKKRGKNEILKELNEASKYFDFRESQSAVKEGIELAQAINPDIPIKPYPVVFLFIPSRNDAKALHGQGCAINIDSLKSSKIHPHSPKEKIISYIAHESVHVFLKQLNLDTNGKGQSTKEGIFSFIWEEGLTTYIEPKHYHHHDIIEADAPFWIRTINMWFNTDTQGKSRLIKAIKERDSFKVHFHDMYKLSELPKDTDISDKTLLSLIYKMNGIGYHVGSYLWKKQVEKANMNGKSLKDLVMAGPKQAREWFYESKNS